MGTVAPTLHNSKWGPRGPESSPLESASTGQGPWGCDLRWHVSIAGDWPGERGPVRPEFLFMISGGPALASPGVRGTEPSCRLESAGPRTGRAPDTSTAYRNTPSGSAWAGSRCGGAHRAWPTPTRAPPTALQSTGPFLRSSRGGVGSRHPCLAVSCPAHGPLLGSRSWGSCKGHSQLLARPHGLSGDSGLCIPISP